jgi:hypothetical protein
MKTSPRALPTYRGRSIGVVFLVAAQILVGFIHVVFGVWMLASPHVGPFAGILGSSSGPDIYSIYTIAFSLLTLLFAAGLWRQKRWGWFGTVAIAIFVIIADSLTLLNLPSIPGNPKFAGFGEISYSVLVLIYLSQRHLRIKYQIGTTLPKNDN